MKTEIMCPVNLFDLNQVIYICGDNRQEAIGTTTTNSISEDMIAAGIANGVSNYHILGNTLFAEKVAENIKQIYYSKYNNQEIEVKVN